jgi:anti-sigma factor RsiW
VLEDDDGDRDRWRRYAARPGAPRPPACPDDAVLAAFAEGETAPAERERLEAHLCACARCTSAVAEALRIEQVPVPVVREHEIARLARAVRAEVGRPWRAPEWIAVAAALVLACAGGFLLGARTMSGVAALGRAGGDALFELSALVSGP